MTTQFHGLTPITNTAQDWNKELQYREEDEDDEDEEDKDEDDGEEDEDDEDGHNHESNGEAADNQDPKE